MQGLESLNQFQNFVSSLGGLGRFEDTYMIHAAEGETVVPMEVLNQNPLLKERLFESMRDMGIQPERYIVGSEFNSKNPVTGQPEFFLKRIKKAIADVSGYAAPIVGAMYGPAAGALTGAAMGAFKRENPGDPNKALQTALLGGGSGVAGNILAGDRGMDIFTGPGYFQGDWRSLGNKFRLGDMGIGDALGSGISGVGDLLSGATTLLNFKGEKKTLDQVSMEEFGKTYEELDSFQKEAILKKDRSGGANFGKLAGLLGLGTLIGGKLIGEPEDITIDESRLRTPSIDTGQVFSPTQPTTVYTDYDIPIVPYQAAEGGIIGNPHKERPDRIPLNDEMKDQMYDFLLNFMMKKRMEEEMEKKFRITPFDPEAPMEVADGGIIDYFKSFFKDPVKDPATGEGTVSTLQRKKFEMLNNLKRSDLPYDEEEYLRLKELLGKAHGGVMDLRGGGFSLGPGTEKSDSIPAMLSDGEFVMTAKAVRGAGGGDRREGARKMYEAMDRLEAKA